MEFQTILNKTCTYITFKSAIKHRQLILYFLYIFSFQKNVGEQFKKEVYIKNLPPMCVMSRPKAKRLDETENKDLGLCSLFSGDDKQT